MVLINYATKEIVAKIVYYGPALCGKTTNLQYVYTKLNPKKRGKMISLATESDRTLFFDFLPMELGKVQGFKVRFQLYTVPGQVFYGATRRLVLKGADAVVFVADSQEAILEMNIESIEDMKQNLIENNLDPETIPLVFQYNKRDLNGIMEVEELEQRLNWRGVPYTESIAVTGPGVMESFLAITRELIADLKKKHSLMDTDAIKELPPDIFEQEKEPEEVLEAEDMVLEIEHGSGYHTEGEEEEEVVAGEMLDMIETITLADTTLAEEFFDDVRKGVPTSEAKEKVLSAVPVEEKIELSEAAAETMDAEPLETARVVSESPLRVGERELTPDELDMAGQPLETADAPEPEMLSADVPEPEITAEPEPEIAAEPEPEVSAPVQKARPAPKPAARTPKTAPSEPSEKKPPQRKQAASAAAPDAGDRRFSDIQQTLALLAKDVSALSGRLESMPSQAPPPQDSPAPEPDMRIDAVLETLTQLAMEITQLGARIDRRPAGEPPENAFMPTEMEEVKASLGRIEQEVSALRLTLTMMKESISNMDRGGGGPGTGPDFQAALDELRNEFKSAMEGQDRLMLSILEAARETKLSNSDVLEKIEDGIRYIAGGLKDDKGGRKKWF